MGRFLHEPLEGLNLAENRGPCVEARMNAKDARRIVRGIVLCLLLVSGAGCGASSPTAPVSQQQPSPQPQPPGLHE